MADGHDALRAQAENTNQNNVSTNIWNGFKENLQEDTYQDIGAMIGSYAGGFITGGIAFVGTEIITKNILLSTNAAFAGYSAGSTVGEYIGKAAGATYEEWRDGEYDSPAGGGQYGSRDFNLRLLDAWNNNNVSNSYRYEVTGGDFVGAEITFNYDGASAKCLSMGILGTGDPEVLRSCQFEGNLNGAGGNDLLYGFGGKDTLSGGSGNDKLFGGSGNDRMNGNTGTDQLWGGTGADTFILKSDEHLDYIYDFTKEDHFEGDFGVFVAVWRDDRGILAVRNDDGDKIQFWDDIPANEAEAHYWLL